MICNYLTEQNNSVSNLINNSDQSIHIILKNDLEKIIEMKEKQCYYVENDLHDLTI